MCTYLPRPTFIPYKLLQSLWVTVKLRYFIFISYLQSLRVTVELCYFNAILKPMWSSGIFSYLICAPLPYFAIVLLATVPTKKLCRFLLLYQDCITPY